jgi:hypothetical protein
LHVTTLGKKKKGVAPLDLQQSAMEAGHNAKEAKEYTTPRSWMT